ncbi:ATP-dependent RNA helicase DHX8 [Gryllus bimaculatus]|nr:ATP-dependent RNA helicase DHX8 [Gryllus bimaculatus]
MDDRPKRIPECNNFKKTGFCRYGAGCKFSHIIDKPDVIQELFSQLEISKKPSSSVKVGLDSEKQKELRQFLRSYIPNEKRGVTQEHEYDDYEDDASSDDELTEEEKNREHEKVLEDKYQHIPDSVFKRKFLQNIVGNFRASKGIPRDIPCALERNATLDFNLKTKLTDQMQNSPGYKRMMQVRSQLPVFESKDYILDMIKENQVVVISGETGSGKTTQVAQYILDDFILNNRGSVCHIVCTQPRRISAVSVAQRVADERGERCGESVGYQIRLDKQLPRKQGSILFCTTGILLQWLHSDPGLSHVTHVLIDEIHERNMDTDFVMTVIREVLPQRKDLKVILMSATLNAEQFAAYFYKCPIITVPGKLYPVEKYYLEDIISMTGYVKMKQRKSRPRQDASYNQFSDMIVPYVLSLRHKFGEVVIDQLLEPDSEALNLELYQELIEHICENEGPGAILVFLPGWDQISNLCRMLSSSPFFSIIGVPKQASEDRDELEFENDEEAEKREIKILTGVKDRQFLILPLHSKMPSVNQSQVFDPPPPGVRKIIISTNIAETSITINDVVYIIDSGKMKVKSYDAEKNVSVLQDQWVSKANAVQRRVFRVQRGKCYHMYTKARERLFDDFPTPEILRTRLEELILTIKLLELGKVATILNRIMDSPNPKTVNSSLKLLETLRALDGDENLTPLGFHLAKLPLEPHIAKMIILGAIFSCADPILSLAACLSFKEPFFMPLGQDKEVMAKKIIISKGNKSDHLVLAEAFRLWEEVKNKKAARKFCWDNFLSMATFRDLRKLKIEFAEYLHEMGFLKTKNSKDESANTNSENFSVLKAVICAGLYPNVAIVERVQRFTLSGKLEVVVRTPEDGNVKLHRSSINESQQSFESPYLVYHSKMKSSHIFLHDATMVSSLPLILFSHKVYYDPTGKVIRVNDDIAFNCAKDLATLVQELRQEVQKVLDTLVMEPGTVDWASNDQKTKILRAAAELITSEDTTQQKTENDIKEGAKKRK